MELYQRIKQKREELNMSQDDLASKMGYKSRSTIAKIEAGTNDIPQSKIKAFADALQTTPSYLMGWDNFDKEHNKNGKLADEFKKIEKGIKIPVLGKVAAGIPIEATENYDTDEWEEISEIMASSGEYFALKIEGESMEPKFSDGDVVIVKKQEDVESGEIGVIIVNGCDATVKKVIKQENGILLVATNQSVYLPKFYDNKSIKELPVQILGKVVELRAKF